MSKVAEQTLEEQWKRIHGYLPKEDQVLTDRYLEMRAERQSADSTQAAGCAWALVQAAGVALGIWLAAYGIEWGAATFYWTTTVNQANSARSRVELECLQKIKCDCLKGTVPESSRKTDE